MSNLTPEELETFSNLDKRQQLKLAFLAGVTYAPKMRVPDDILWEGKREQYLNLEAELILTGFDAFYDRFEEIL